MACLLSVSPLPETMISQLNLEKPISVKYYMKCKENAFEYVMSEMAAILSRPQCINLLIIQYSYDVECIGTIYGY